MIKKLLLLFVVLCAVLLICTACQKQTVANKEIAPVNQEKNQNQNINFNKGSCTTEGESYSVVPDYLPCCEGLKPISCERPDNSGHCPPGCVGAAYCTKCGDNNCGKGENKCNCPEDCKS